MKLEKEVMRFENLETAKEHFGSVDLYYREFAYIGDQLTLLCGSALAFDDYVESLVKDAFVEMLCRGLGFAWHPKLETELIDFVSPVAEKMIDELEDFGNFKVEYFYDEF